MLSGVIDMKILALSALLFLAAATAGDAASTPPSQTAPHVDAENLSRYLQIARGYETCVLRCEDRYRACLSSAETDDARRSCRLDRSLCEADCGRFGSR